MRTIPPSWPTAMTPQLRFAAQPSVHPKGTCFAVSTGPPLHKGGVCHGAAVASGRCTPRVLVPLRSTAWASPPTEGLSGVRSFVVSPSGASRHLPRRGRQKFPRLFYHIFFLMAEMAPFSRRDTWAWEMPISVETSIWVLPWQKRRARMLRWRSSRRAMASLRAM